MGTSGRPRRPVTDSSDAVDGWLLGFDHPQKATLQAVRKVVLAADPAIEEGIKWNAPSFHVAGAWFATLHLKSRAPARMATSPTALLLHFDVKGRVREGLSIDDPTGLLEWVGKDRAMLVFAGPDEVERCAAAVRALVRAWLAARAGG